jgi:hypothetical protein
MELRVWLRRPALAALLVLAVLLTPAGAVAKKPSNGGGGGFSTTSTYVKNYANVLNGVEYTLTPEGVQAASDGNWTALALTQAAEGGGVSWLLKSSALGAPQWAKEVGCLNGAPGDYSDATALQLTRDGGYVLAGGTIGCGSGSNCPELTGLQCGLIERLDGSGAIVWARVYAAGADGTAIDDIKQTADGGFVAVGNASDVNHDTGALIMKLDSFGDVQWQRELGPTSGRQAYFHAVRQTADGGYIAVGELDTGASSNVGLPMISVLATKFDAAGNTVWQRAFNDTGSSGVTATEHAQAVVQTADGGYAIGGAWDSALRGPGSCCQGALLLKLSGGGSIQWQKAYSGGVVCSDQFCHTIGGDVYSLDQTADGGYLVAGDADSPQLVPWLAKVDGNGALIWQQADYQVNPEYGTPLSEYFAASAFTPIGPLAIGSTQNYSNGLGELLGVQTDQNGNVGTCPQIHPTAALSATDPGLAAFAPSLTATTSVASQSASPARTQTTTATATAAQC